MTALRSLLAASIVLIASGQLAVAQDTMDHGAELPAACKTGKAPPMQDMGTMESSMQGLDEAQKAFMEGMMQTHLPMMEGIMAEDTDIAFACGMIPHHRAAIAMAKVELQYGDNEWTKEMATKIIAAQEQEIAELTKWIVEQTE